MTFLDQTDEVSDQLTSGMIESLALALPSVLRALVGEADLVVRYGAGCGIHGDLWLVPMQLNVSSLAEFMQRSLTQKIFLPGEAEIRIDLKNGQLKVAFCNEAHLHVGGSSAQLRKELLASEPFDNINMVGRSDGLG